MRLTDEQIEKQWADEWDGFVSFEEARVIVRWAEAVVHQSAGAGEPVAWESSLAPGVFTNDPGMVAFWRKTPGEQPKALVYAHPAPAGDATQGDAGALAERLWNILKKHPDAIWSVNGENDWIILRPSGGDEEAISIDTVRFLASALAKPAKGDAGALAALVAECERANAACLKQIGMGVIDLNAISAAKAALSQQPAPRYTITQAPAVEELFRISASGEWTWNAKLQPLVDHIRSQQPAKEAPAGYSIHFADERDFCRFASILIGAAYTHAPDALKRFEQRSLWGEGTHGVVTASTSPAAAPAPQAEQALARDPDGDVSMDFQSDTGLFSASVSPAGKMVWAVAGKGGDKSGTVMLDPAVFETLDAALSTHSGEKAAPAAPVGDVGEAE